MSLEAGAVIAWFDWAPDSEHLGISVTDSECVWLRSYSVSTAELPRLGPSPSSSSLSEHSDVRVVTHGRCTPLLYQKVDLDTG